MRQINHFNAGIGCEIQPIDIGHRDYIGIVSPDTAFWALVRKKELGEILTGSSLLKRYRRKAGVFGQEIDALRFGLRPSAVYFNPTDKCNLNCAYCYIPKNLRRHGKHMPTQRLFKALEILKGYFKAALPKGHKPSRRRRGDSQSQKPQVVFHGAEPLLNKKAVFLAIDKFNQDFRFGIQTNATLLDSEAIGFLTKRRISIGLSLDGNTFQVADRLRRTWSGCGVSGKVIEAIKRLKSYENYSVICTVTKQNVASLVKMVEFLHRLEVPACMLNPLRCTLTPSRKYKPDDSDMAKYYLKALDRVYQLYRKTGRKLVVANFANVLISIIAPSARRLMCDISPCGGGRCFFAISASGDLFPCSEFIGLKKFKGGNVFKDDINKVLESRLFKLVTQRRIENIEPCFRCAIRHFCGAPCPAESYAMNSLVETRGAFCEFYEEQVRYAFRLIADEKVDPYLWDEWDKDTIDVF